MKHLPSFLLFLLLVACGESHQQMVLQLEELERQNRADSLMLNDSLALHLADYFDRHGSANERLRAHYILGRTYADMGEAPAALEAYYLAANLADTTSAECDFATLSRIHAQSATILHNQIQPRSELQELKLASYYAWKAKDTIQAIECFAQQADAYYFLNLADSAINIKEIAAKLYEDVGRRDFSSRTLITIILQLIEKKQLAKAERYLKDYEQFSGLVDENGKVESGREIFYYIKGRYLLSVNNVDSAEKMFRKELEFGRDLNNQIAGNKGLQDVYNYHRNSDSVAKYATLGYELNDSAYSMAEMQNIQKLLASYNYSRHQSIANKEHERAERERKAKNMLFLAVALALVAIGSIVYAWRRRKKAAEARYESIAASLKRAEGELANLHALEAEKTDLQALSDELYRQIAAKEAAVGHLQREIAQLRRENVPQVSVAEQQLSQSDLYRRLHQSAKCEAIPEEEWQAIDAMVRDTLPGYHRFLSSLRYSPDSNEYRICLLLRLHIRMQDASGFIGISKSYVSRMSSTILDEVFAIKGSGKELQKQLERME